MNVDTGEVFRLLKTMRAGEELRVYTHFAGKRVIQIENDKETNAFSYMDTASTFLQLALGINTLRYSASSNMDFELSLKMANGINPRIDRVVLRWSNTDRQIKLAVKTGAA